MNKPHYTVKRFFLWEYQVINLHGKRVFVGSKESCEQFKKLLEAIYDLGYAEGRAVEAGLYN